MQKNVINVNIILKYVHIVDSYIPKYQTIDCHFW